MRRQNVKLIRESQKPGSIIDVYPRTYTYISESQFTNFIELSYTNIHMIRKLFKYEYSESELTEE